MEHKVEYGDCIILPTISSPPKGTKWGLRGRVVIDVDFKSLAPHRCRFELCHVRKLNSWLVEGRWLYPGASSWGLPPPIIG